MTLAVSRGQRSQRDSVQQEDATQAGIARKPTSECPAAATRAQVSVASRGDWPKRTQDQAYLDGLRAAHVRAGRGCLMIDSS